jgi:hypothetical protein
MHDEPTPNARTRDVGDIERDVVYLLTDPSRNPTIWSIADLGREVEYFDPESIVLPLHRAGLLHRTGAFVFATPAAFHLVGLVGDTI